MATQFELEAALSPQVRNVARRLRGAGFSVVLGEGNRFVAARDVERGLRRVERRSPATSDTWLTFAGWPPRRGNLLDLRAWLDSYGAPL